MIETELEKREENLLKKTEPSGFSPFLIDEKQTIGAVPISIPDKAPEKEKPGFSETVGAVLHENFWARKYETLNRSLLNLKEMITAPEHGFNVLQEQYLSQVDPEFWPEVTDAVNENDFYRMKAAIDERVKNKKIIQEGSTPGWLTGNIINGATNPFYYAGIGAAVRPLQFVPGIKNILTSTVPAWLIGAGADEADLYFNHNARAAEEAVFNTAVSGIMGGIFGGAVLGARSLKLNTYKKLISEAAQGNDVKFRFNKAGEVDGFSIHDDSAGSKSVRNIDLIGESLYGWGENGQLHVATPAIWVTGKVFQNPVVRGLMSKSQAVRGFVNDALEHNLDLTQVVKATGAPPEAIQTAIQRRQAASFNFQVELADGYYEYLGIDPSKNFLSKIVASKLKDKTDLYSFKEYNKQFYLATVDGGVHENGIIASRSKKFINEKLLPIYEELVELGQLPPNLTPKGAAQHVMRVYDREHITSNKKDVARFLKNKFAETNEKILKEDAPSRELRTKIGNLKEDLKSVKNKETKKRLDSELKELESKLEILEKEHQRKLYAGEYSDDMVIGDINKKDLKFRSILNDEELDASVRDTIDTILGLTEEQMNSQILDLFATGTGGTNPLKRRSLMISDKELLESGMLLSDIRASFGAYNTRMARFIEMEKYVRSQGYTGEGTKLEFLTNGINNDYKRLEAALEAKYDKAIKGKSGKELEKIEKKYSKKRIKLEDELKTDINTVSTIYKRLMGETGVKYGAALKLINGIKQYYYATELGAMALLMMQDVIVPMFNKGVSRYFNQGVRPFLTNLAKGDFKSNKRLRQSAMDLNLGIETLQAFYNMNFPLDRDSFVPLNMFEKLTGQAANAMGILNFSSFISDALQHVSATASQSSIARDLMSALKGELSPTYLRRLLNLRIDPKSSVAKTLAEQAEIHGEWHNGAFLPNSHLWNIDTPLQREAKNLFEGAVRKDVRATLFSGSNMASYPLWAEPNGISGAFLMYMGWGFNATANFTLPLFQKLQGNRATTAAMMVLISSLVEPLRMLAAGKDIPEEDLEPATLLKKGIMNSGVLGAYMDMFNKMNAIGDVLPSLRADRFKNTRGLIQFGPERMVTDALNVLGMFANQEYNKKDIKRILKNVPLANLIYTRKMLNDYVDSFDVPETRYQASRLKEWR